MGCEECAATRMKQMFDQHASGIRPPGLIRSENGCPVIDWVQYVEIKESRGSRSERALGEIHEILLAVRVFSTNPTGNWCVVSDTQLTLNPWPEFLHYFFTRKEDVLAYARAALTNTVFAWEIRHIGETISKEDALKEEVGASGS